MITICRTLATVIAVVCATVSAGAQTYPSRQITLVVPYAPGGPVDNAGRALADALRRQLNAPVVIDNRPGAGGVVGTKIVSAARPDGYMLLVGSAGPLVIAPAAGGASVEAETQLTPVGLINESPQILVASTTVKAETLAEFIAFAKSGAGQLNYGSAGIGTTPHLAGELFKSLTSLDMLHVPYRGTGAALPDLISGRIHIMFGDITAVAAMVEAGRLRAYAITGLQRSEIVPKVPTTAEAGHPKLVTRNWNALMGPPGLGQPILARLVEAMRAAVSDSEYIGVMRKQGTAPSASSPDHLVKFIGEERQRWAPIVKAIGLKLE